MKQIERVLNNKENINLDFVVHIKNEKELNELIEVLVNNNFEIEFNLFEEELCEWMRRVAKEDRFNTCFRLKNRENEKYVAWNASIEHWRLYCPNILELENGELIFNEGKYTYETAAIEADKIIELIAEGSYLKNLYGDKTKEQIIESLCMIRDDSGNGDV